MTLCHSLLLADAMSLPFLGNLLAAALQSQFVCVSADVTCEVQGGDQASQDPHLDDSSSELNTCDDSSASNEEDGSSPDSDSNCTDTDIYELDDGDIPPQELALRHETLQTLAAAIARPN